MFNPSSHQDASMHHFASSLKNFIMSDIFLHLPPTSSHLHPPQVENYDSNSRLVVDEDDTVKFRLERFKHGGSYIVARIGYIFLRVAILYLVLVRETK